MKATSKNYTLPVENWSDITHVIVKNRDLHDTRNQTTFTIKDFDTIQVVIEFFTERKMGWMHPWDTVPAGRYSVGLYKNDTLLQVFFISGVFVTFDENGHHLWRFSEKGDYDKLSKIIGLS